MTFTYMNVCIPFPENSSEVSKKSDEEGRSATNGETQLTTPTSTERGKGKLEKKRKGKEKAEGRVIYDRVSLGKG